MRINPRKTTVFLVDKSRQLKTYLKHPDTDLRQILGVFSLLCILGWFLIKGEWLIAVVILGLVTVMVLSYTIFDNAGVLILNAFRKEQFDSKLARKIAILTLILLVLVTLLVVTDTALDFAVGIIIIMALRVVLIFVLALATRK